MIKKIAILGGTSPNAPEIIELLHQQQVPCSELCFIARNEKDLGIIAGFAGRLADEIGYETSVTHATDPSQGLRDASVVINLVRIGGRDTWNKVEHIAHAFGIGGHAGHNIGVMTNLNEILAYGKTMAAVCPGAPLIEFTNPCGIHGEAFARELPQVPLLTGCPAPLRERRAIAALLEVSPEEEAAGEIEMDWYGFNHLAWIPRIMHRDTDVTAEVAARDAKSAKPRFRTGWYEETGVIPAMLAGSAFSHPTPASDPEAQAATFHPDPNGGLKRKANYEAFADSSRSPSEVLNAKGRVDWHRLAMVPILEGYFTDRPRRYYASVPVEKALPGFPGKTVECGVTVRRGTLKPMPLPEIPSTIGALARLLRTSEELMIQAAKEKCRRSLVESLIINPGCMDPELAGRFTDCLNKELDLGLS